MKQTTIRRIFSAMLLAVFIFGSVSSYAKPVAKAEFCKQVKELKAKNFFTEFVNDAIVIDVPTHNIGYFVFAYKLDAGKTDIPLPVAHGPPKRSQA